LNDKKNKDKVDAVHVMKAYKEDEVQPHSFCTPAPDAGQWSDSSPSHFIKRERSPERVSVYLS